MGVWFQESVLAAGKLRLFCFFVAFIATFLFIRFSVRMIRAQVKWWPGNVTPGGVHVHHAVFGVIFMCVGGVGGLAVQQNRSAWAAVTAALLGIGMALVLDEFALVLFLKDVYWGERDGCRWRSSLSPWPCAVWPSSAGSRSASRRPRGTNRVWRAS